MFMIMRTLSTIYTLDFPYFVGSFSQSFLFLPILTCFGVEKFIDLVDSSCGSTITTSHIIETSRLIFLKLCICASASGTPHIVLHVFSVKG